MSYQDLLSALLGSVCMGVEDEDVQRLLAKLPVRQRDILVRLYGLGGVRETLKEIGSSHNVVGERIRQIHAKALAQLRLQLTREYENLFTGIVLTKRRSTLEKEVTSLPVLSEEEECWITGFCEGDGSVGMSGLKHSFAVFTQKEPDVLEYIESLLPGGTWYLSKQNMMWSLSYAGELQRVLFDLLAKHTVSEHFTSRLNGVLANAGMSTTVKHVPTVNWLAGFFDAEGTVLWKNPQCGLQIGQKEGYVLNVIQQVFGGHVGPRRKQFQWYMGKTRTDLVGLANKLQKCSHKFQKKEDLTSLLTRLYVEKHQIT